MSFDSLITTLGRQAREASLVLATTDSLRKNAALLRLAALLGERADVIVAANKKDLAAATAAGLAKPMVDRLTA